jgi:hypothetical protein
MVEKVIFAGAILREARLANADIARTDLSYCDLRGADLTGTKADRSSFYKANLEGVKAPDSSMEFADFRLAKMGKAVLLRASLVGADTGDAVFDGADLTEADLFWTTLSAEKLITSKADHARFPVETVVAYGPRGVTPPLVNAKPLYPVALTEAERKERAKQRPKNQTPAMASEKHDG